MIREYEFILVTRADQQDGDRQRLLEKYEAYLAAEGGDILKKDVWGIKKLSFPIKRQFRGHYVVYYSASESSALKEMERLMRIDDQVLRYLIVKVDEQIDIEARKQELARPPKPVSQESYA